jgi:hypothetical protein
MIKRPTWIVLALLAMLIGAYFYLEAHPLKTAAATPTPAETEAGFLIPKGDDVLTGIAITDAQGRAFQMRRDAAAAWTISLPRKSAADQARAEAAETQLFALGVTTTLETSPSPEALGLDPPAYTITLEFSSGKQQVLEMGGPTPTGSGYYVRTEGKVYVVNQYSLDAVVNLLETPPYPATPTP